jgi:hypothetical protein
MAHGGSTYVQIGLSIGGVESNKLIRRVYIYSSFNWTMDLAYARYVIKWSGHLIELIKYLVDQLVAGGHSIMCI